MLLTKMFSKTQLLLLIKATEHYIKHQVGASSSQSLEYKEIMKVLEKHLDLLD